MKFSRIIAMTAALSLTAGVFYNVGRSAKLDTATGLSVFGDIDGDGTVTPMDASILLSYYAYLSTVVGTPMTLEEYLVYGSGSTPTVPDDHQIDPSVKTDGDTFTIACWNPDDVPYLIAQWKGLDYRTVSDDLENDRVDGVKFINFDVGGSYASEIYDIMFMSGDDIDVYFCEADWIRKYTDNDKRTLPLSKLGLTDDDFANVYSYTDDIGTNSKGVRKGVSWSSCAGAYAYRADLAKEYLGVDSPEEMQSMISDWDGFVSSALTVRKNSGDSVAMADSVGGMCRAYFCGTTSPWVVNDELYLGNNIKEFADQVRTLYNTGAVTHNGQWTDSWTYDGFTGKVMGYFVPTWDLEAWEEFSFLEIASRRSYGEWAMCEGPQSYYWGGTWIVVNSDTDNGEEARDFVLSAVSDEVHMCEYALNKPEFVNNQMVMDYLIETNTVFNAKVTGNFVNGQNVYAVFDSNAKQIERRGVITSYDGQVESIIQSGIQAYCENNYTWSEIERKMYTAFENGYNYVN